MSRKPILHPVYKKEIVLDYTNEMGHHLQKQKQGQIKQFYFSV
jgi:hypothetical protein